MLDPDRELPMVAPADVGREAARLMTAPAAPTGTVFVEGPVRLTPQDVADTFTAVLGRPVRVVRTRRAQWRAAFQAAGLSPEATETFVGLNEVVDRERWLVKGRPVQGTITFAEHVRRLVG